MQGINKKEYIKKVLKLDEYVNGDESGKLIDNLASLYSVDKKKIFLLGNGRSAQYLFLKSLNLKPTDNVVMQGYTCNAAVGPVFWSGVKVRYVDIDVQNYSLSLEHLKKVVDENTRVIIIQHTYGIPGPTKAVREFAKSRNIIIFEDCAHSLGMVDDDGNLLGKNSDAALISFGIDKVLNTRVGGALIVNNSKYLEAVEKEYIKVQRMGYWDTFIWLLNPFVWFVLAKFRGARKRVARLLTQLGLLNMGFYSCEFTPQMPKQYPRKLSNALSWFVNQELASLGGNLSHRGKTVSYYDDLLDDVFEKSIDGLVEWQKWERPLVKFPVLLPNREIRNIVYEKLMAKGILVSKWYDPVIFPEGKGLESMRYSTGLCPNAESISARIIALPTGLNVNKKRVGEIVEIIRREVEQLYAQKGMQI